MPLIQGKSKKAMSENIKREMNAGKPQKQSIAIAYNIQRKNKNKKKMAEGGELSANDEIMTTEDDASDSRNMDMMHGKKPSLKQELDTRDEIMTTEDDASDPREMDMMKKKPRFAEGGELDAKKEKMVTIDDSWSSRNSNMLDSKPMRHAEELDAKKEKHATEDDALTDRDEDMLHQHGQPDEYSKEGIINYAKGGRVRLDNEEERPRSIAESIMKKMMAEGGQVDLDRNADEDLNYEDQLSYRAGRQQNYDEHDALDQLNQPADSNEHGDHLEDADENNHDMIDKIMKKLRMRR